MGLLQRCTLLLVLSIVISKGCAKDWNHFVFAQAWPPATCAEAPKRHHKCYIGREVTTWTIHGLWPAYNAEHGPDSCNISAKFNFSQIADLKDRLMKYWPDLYSESFDDRFWKHEWVKHGTCCMDLQSTSGEHNYFDTSLNLNRKYDIMDILEQNNIVPDSTTEYKTSDIINAVEEVTGFEPLLECTTTVQYDSDGRLTKQSIIGQIKICLQKDLTPMACPQRDYHSMTSERATSRNEDNPGKDTDLGFNICPHMVQYPPISYD